MNNFKVLQFILLFLVFSTFTCSSENMKFKERYSLKDNETIKVFKYPYDDIRNKNIQSFTPHLSDKDIAYHNAVYFTFLNDSLIHHSTTSGPPNLKMIISNILPYNYIDIVGDTSILNIQITGDFVFRPDASLNDLISNLKTILSKEINFDIHLLPIKEEKESIVASGECKFIPLQNHPQDTLFIYTDKRPTKLDYCCPRTSKPTTLDDFFTLLGFALNKHIINEVNNPNIELPILGICARPSGQEELNKLLLNVSKQLNINLNTENRTIEVLSVTK